MYEHFVRFGKIENRQREVAWEKYFCFFIILVGEYEYEIKHLIFINSDKYRHQYILAKFLPPLSVQDLNRCLYFIEYTTNI